MDIDSTSTLCNQLAKMTDPQQIKYLVLSYGNKRETRGFEHAWLKCQGVYQRHMARRKTSIKNFIPNYEPDGTISLNTLNKIFFKIFDELRDVKNGKYDIKNFQDYLFNIVGDIKIDRRLCFKKE